MESVRTVLSKYVTFSGRARRSEYWWFTLFNAIVSFVLYGLLIGGGLASSTTYDASGRAVATSASPMLMLGTGLFGLWTLLMLLPSLAVGVRRLHDTNRSGWWYLIALIPFGGIVLLVFMATEGTPGPNQYGPDPKGRDQMYGGYAAPGGAMGGGQYGMPAAPQYGTPQDQAGTPQYGTPQYGTPQNGAPQYGTPQYGTPQNGAPQYGTPAPGDNPFASPDERA